MLSPSIKSMFKLLKEYESNVSNVSCRKFGNRYLVTVIEPTSAGDNRVDTSLKSNGKRTDVRETLSEALSGNISATISLGLRAIR
jgi:hypothetical protein